MLSFELALIAFLIVFMSTLFHEFGHYIGGKIIGISPEYIKVGKGPQIYNIESLQIKLIPISGYVKYKKEEYILLTSKEKILVASLGPLFELILLLINSIIIGVLNDSMNWLLLFIGGILAIIVSQAHKSLLAILPIISIALLLYTVLNGSINTLLFFSQSYLISMIAINIHPSKGTDGYHIKKEIYKLKSCPNT